MLDGALERLAGRPVLYVAADRDLMVTRASAEELFARAPEPKSYAVVSSDHTYAGENARAAVLAWLNERHPRAPKPEPVSSQSARVVSPVRSAGLRRYSRHLLIPEIGLAGQERLLRARVLVVGAGGLGSPVLQYLAAAGVGRIGIVDDDVVDLTNLQRQTLFATPDVGRQKADVAAERVARSIPTSRSTRIRCGSTPATPAISCVRTTRSSTRPTRSVRAISSTTRAASKVNPTYSRRSSASTGRSRSSRRAAPAIAASSRTAARGQRPDVRRGWRAGRVARHRRRVAGVGGAQGRARDRQAARRAAAVDRRTRRRTREVLIERDPQCALCGDAPSIRDVAEIARAPQPPTDVPELTAAALDAWLADNPGAAVLDVREPHEIVLGTLVATLHVPASQLDARLHELDSARTYVVACRIGQKSRWAAQRLWDAGFRRLRHLDGGLLAYAAAQEAFDAF